MPTERVQKILSANGFGSRRDCEKIISDHRVKVNHETIDLGAKADTLVDKIFVDGVRVDTKQKKFVYIALNKPPSVLSDIKKVSNRTNISDLVDQNEYVFIVGRLDYRSEGLILLTNDGELANRLTHPRYEHEKEYRVLVQGTPTAKQIHRWKEGVLLENGYRTMPADVKVESTVGNSSWMRVVMREGKKRQIREVGRLLKLSVKRLIRTRIATLELGTLEIGKWRYLTNAEISKLRKEAHT